MNPITAVGIKETNIFITNSLWFNKNLKYIITTESIAPDWIKTSKNFMNSVCEIPTSFDVIIKWAVEEMGRNSVTPSTTPNTNE